MPSFRDIIEKNTGSFVDEQVDEAFKRLDQYLIDRYAVVGAVVLFFLVVVNAFIYHFFNR